MEKKNKLKIFSGIAIGGALALTGVLVGTDLAKNDFFASNAKEVGNVLTINKDSDRDTIKSKVTATTEKGNEVQFSYNRFDTRPTGELSKYNQCICFYKVDKGLGGYITNDTPLYSVESIKIYEFSTTNPNPTTLCKQNFYLYYGFGPIVIDHSNGGKVQISNGQYTFEDGTEPSYIALECLQDSDTTVSKIEITYKCEPVIGEINDVGTTAFKYEHGAGKEFTSLSGKKILYNFDRAPWARVSFDKFTKIDSQGVNKSYDAKFEKTNTEVKYIGYYNGGIRVDVGDLSIGRNILSVTLRSSTWEWGGACFYIRAYADDKLAKQVCPTVQIYNVNGVNSFLANGGKIINSQGQEVSSINATDFFTYEIDLTSRLGENERVKFVDMWSGYNGDDSPNYANVPTLTVKDVTFKETFCGHKASYIEKTGDTESTCTVPGKITYSCTYPDCGVIASETEKPLAEHNWIQKTQVAHEFDWGGTATVCSVCGAVDGDIENYVKAPWAYAPVDTSKGGGYTTVTEGQEFILGGKSGVTIFYDISEAVRDGRTKLAVTAKTNSTTYEFFYCYFTNASGEIGQYQFFSPDLSTINYQGSCGFIDAILDANGGQIYDTTAKTNLMIGATDEVTVIFDLTNALLEGVTSLKMWAGNDVLTNVKVSFRDSVGIKKLIANTTWDDWYKYFGTKTNGANFTVSYTADTVQAALDSGRDATTSYTLGNFFTTYRSKNVPDANYNVLRFKFKMVKDLAAPDTAGSMQWYVGFDNSARLIIGNASDAFAQRDDMHLLDKDLKLVENGTRISLNTEYYVEILVSDTMPSNHLTFRAEATASTVENKWGYGHFIVSDFNQCFQPASTSFAA